MSSGSRSRKVSSQVRCGMSFSVKMSGATSSFTKWSTGTSRRIRQSRCRFCSARPLLGRETAIHGELRARDVTGLVTSQEQRAVGDINGVAHVAQGNRGSDNRVLLPVVLQCNLLHV